MCYHNVNYNDARYFLIASAVYGNTVLFRISVASLLCQKPLCVSIAPKVSIDRHVEVHDNAHYRNAQYLPDASAVH